MARRRSATLFVAFRGDYVQAVLASLLMGVLISIGFVLLVIPGFIAIVRLAWVPYPSPTSTSTRSARCARLGAHARPRLDDLRLFLLAIPIVLIGLVLLIVGVIPALMLAQLASAALYADVTARIGITRATGDGRSRSALSRSTNAPARSGERVRRKNILGLEHRLEQIARDALRGVRETRGIGARLEAAARPCRSCRGRSIARCRRAR